MIINIKTTIKFEQQKHGSGLKSQFTKKDEIVTVTTSLSFLMLSSSGDSRSNDISSLSSTTSVIIVSIDEKTFSG